MLMGEARQGQGASPAKDPAQVKEWFYVGPHVMIVLPDTAQDALRGINQDLAEKCRRVARRISFTTFSANSFTGPDFCLVL